MKDDKWDPMIIILFFGIVFVMSCLLGLVVSGMHHESGVRCLDNITVLVTSKTIQNNKCTLYSNGSLFVCTEWVYSEIRVGHVYVLQFDATQSIHRIVIRAIEE